MGSDGSLGNGSRGRRRARRRRRPGSAETPGEVSAAGVPAGADPALVAGCGRRSSPAAWSVRRGGDRRWPREAEGVGVPLRAGPQRGGPGPSRPGTWDRGPAGIEIRPARPGRVALRGAELVDGTASWPRGTVRSASAAAPPPWEACPSSSIRLKVVRQASHGDKLNLE